MREVGDAPAGAAAYGRQMGSGGPPVGFAGRGGEEGCGATWRSAGGQEQRRRGAQVEARPLGARQVAADEQAGAENDEGRRLEVGGGLGVPKNGKGAS